MHLNHLDLSVPDVDRAEHLFRTLFGFVRLRRNATTGHAVLVGDGGFVLVLSPTEGGAPAAYPPEFHIGFHVDDPAALDDLYARVQAEGLAVVHPLGPAAFGGGTAFYCRGPGEIMIELAHRPG